MEKREYNIHWYREVKRQLTGKGLQTFEIDKKPMSEQKGSLGQWAKSQTLSPKFIFQLLVAAVESY
jgi:predicted fused transcriptional regulator/phosphomethylpyrimidine kinase